MSASLRDAGWVLYQMYGGQGTREEYDARMDAQNAERAREDARRRAERFKRARRAHGSQGGSLRRERPGWQRSGADWRGRGGRIRPAMTNPRVRGQLVTR